MFSAEQKNTRVPCNTEHPRTRSQQPAHSQFIWRWQQQHSQRRRRRQQHSQWLWLQKQRGYEQDIQHLLCTQETKPSAMHMHQRPILSLFRNWNNGTLEWGQRKPTHQQAATMVCCCHMYPSPKPPSESPLLPTQSCQAEVELEKGTE